MEPSREHPDNFKRLPVENGFAPDDLWIAPEHPQPGTMADHRDVRWEHGVLAGHKQPPQNRLGAKCLKETLGDAGTNQRLWLEAVEIVEARGGCGCDVTEGLRSIVPIKKRARRDAFAFFRMLTIGEPDCHDAIGFAVRKLAQKQRIDNREDGDRAANADGQDSYSERRHHRPATKHAKGVLHIAHDVVVGGELLAQPCRIADRSCGAAYDVGLILPASPGSAVHG